MIHLTLAMCALWGGPAPDDSRTLEVDAVELVAGREVAGKASLTAQRGIFTYRFATEANRRAFLAAPQKYEIQLGGGCGRMGPLSGVGSTRLFSVHKNRIYVFASESCREGFRKSPDALIDRADPKPSPGVESSAQAVKLLDRAAGKIASPEMWKKLRSVQYERKRTVKSGDRDYLNRTVHSVVFPDRFRDDSQWDDDKWGSVTGPKAGWFEEPDGSSRKMAPVQTAALTRRFFGDPIVILANRNARGTVVETLKPETIEGTRFDRVRVWQRGIAVVLTLAPDGAIHSTTVRDRGAAMSFTSVRRVFTKWRIVNGIRWPVEETRLNNGKPVKTPVAAWTKVTVNKDLAGLFRPTSRLPRAGK